MEDVYRIGELTKVDDNRTMAVIRLTLAAIHTLHDILRIKQHSLKVDNAHHNIRQMTKVEDNYIQTKTGIGVTHAVLDIII